MSPSQVSDCLLMCHQVTVKGTVEHTKVLTDPRKTNAAADRKLLRICNQEQPKLKSILHGSSILIRAIRPTYIRLTSDR